MKQLFGIRRDYRAVSYALCSAVAGVLFMRIIVYFAPIDSSTYGMSLCSDLLFTLPVQLLFFLAIPFCIYKFYGKRTFKQVLDYSSIGKFKPYYLIAIPVGVCAFFVTVVVSSAWMGLLELTGYNYIPSTPEKPENFVFGFMLTELILTALLPAVCEEFVMRGGFLTTAKSTLGTVGCVVLCGIAFGLFHQNVRQVFYTMLFGALAGFLTLRLKSIYPAMLMHFANNFTSVYIDYATDYDWAFGGGFYNMFDGKLWAVSLIILAAAGTGVGLVILMLYFKDKRVIDRKREVIKDAAFDATNKRVVLMGEFDPQKVQDLEMEKEVYGKDYVEEKFKPAPRDIMIIVAAGVTALLSTVFTYVWGFFY